MKLGEQRANEEVTAEKALDRMANYKDNKEAYHQFLAMYRAEIGYGLVAQYEGADMPKAPTKGNADLVAQNAIDRSENAFATTLYEKQVRWVENRQARIEDEQLAIIFGLRLQGYTVGTISAVTRKSKRTVTYMLRQCAEILTEEG